MASIEEMNKKMTLYFSKSSREVTRYMTGISDMGAFAKNKDDFEIIWDYIVIDRDDYVINNFDKFYINENKELKLKENIDLSKYL